MRSSEAETVRARQRLRPAPATTQQHGSEYAQLSRQASYAAGLLLGNLGIGLSCGWWVAKHHRRHAHPSQVGGSAAV